VRAGKGSLSDPTGEKAIRLRTAADGLFVCYLTGSAVAMVFMARIR
jgi:hypothetical protein